MCDCELHDPRVGVSICTCLCQEHDHLWPSDQETLRAAARRFIRFMAVTKERLDDVGRLSLSLPPDKWDRFGARWTCIGRSRQGGGLLWRCVEGGRVFADEELGERGPFAETSPLAEDQPPHRDERVEKIAKAMSSVHFPHGSHTSTFGRSYTDRLAQVAYDTMNADAELEVKEDSADATRDPEDGMTDDEAGDALMDALHESRSDDRQALINRALKAEAEVADLRRALGELRTDFIRIHAIAGQHAAYEGSKE